MSDTVVPFKKKGKVKPDDDLYSFKCECECQWFKLNCNGTVECAHCAAIMDNLTIVEDTGGTG
jgi:hypothetical protein